MILRSIGDNLLREDGEEHCHSKAQKHTRSQPMQFSVQRPHADDFPLRLFGFLDAGYGGHHLTFKDAVVFADEGDDGEEGEEGDCRGGGEVDRCRGGVSCICGEKLIGGGGGGGGCRDGEDREDLSD